MKKLLLGAMIPAALLLIVPQDARASIDIDSSMNAVCSSDLGCNVIDFELNLTPGDYLIKTIVLESNDAAWQFQSLEAIWDADGDALAWSSGVSPDGLELTATDLYELAAEPLSIRVRMGSWGLEEDLGSSLSYWGAGETVDDEKVSFEGDLATVPEPASTALLATGLFGLAALAGRRRTPLAKDEDAEDRTA